MTDATYVDGPHQHSPGTHVHVRGTDQCIHREDGELCPTWQERAEKAEATVARVQSLAAEVDVYYPFKFVFGAAQNYTDGYKAARADLWTALRGES